MSFMLLSGVVVLFGVVHGVIKMEVLKVGLSGWVRLLLGVFKDEMRGGCWFICGLLSKKSVGLSGCLREF
jgi:hypothetical protein